MIEIKNLSIERDNVGIIISQLNLDISPCKITALTGPSGCGKSTFLNCLLGVISAKSGEINFDGQVYQNNEYLLPIEKRDFGVVFQNLVLFDHLSVRDNISYGLSHHTDNERQEISNKMLQTFGLTDKADAFASDLSGGQRQRLAIARSLAPSPKFLLLDEVFSSLDPELRKELRNEIRLSLKELKIGALLVTHDHQDVLDFCDQVIVLDEYGNVIKQGDVIDVIGI